MSQSANQMIASLSGRLAELERRQARRLLASRTDISPTVRAKLETASIAEIGRAIEIIDTDRAERGGPPRGARQLDNAAASGVTERAPRLPPAERRAMDIRMGINVASGGVHREGNAVVFGEMTPDQARRHLASRGAR